MSMFADQVPSGAGKLLLASVVWCTPDMTWKPRLFPEPQFPHVCSEEVAFQAGSAGAQRVPQVEAPGHPLPLPASHIGTSSLSPWEIGPVLNVEPRLAAPPQRPGQVLYLETVQ